MDFLNEQFSLKDEVAAVVGGAGELCSAIARGFAKAGAKVAVIDPNKELGPKRVAAIRDAGGEAEFIAADATKKADLESAAAEVTKRWGKITIALNGAGINSATPFLEISEQEVQKMLDIDYKSVMFGCQVFGGLMIRQGQGGAILNVSSMAALRPLSRVFTYSAAKAAVHNLTLNLAREWGPEGVRVNAIVPGFFPAEQNRRVLDKERVDKILSHTPMGRFGEADELVGASILLCSRKAGQFITGCSLVVDGGFSATTF